MKIFGFPIIILAIFSICTLNTKKSDLIDTSNFQLLMKQNPPKTQKKNNSFFNFPEAKKMAEKRLLNNKHFSISSSPETNQVSSERSSLKINRKLNKIPKKTFHPNDIHLSPEIQDILPNADQILNALKPVKPRFLKQKPSAVKKSTLSSASSSASTPAHKKLPEKLEAFEKFNKDVSSSSNLSNRKLIRNFNLNQQISRETAEQNYQSFIMHATNIYMREKMSLWNQAKNRYDIRQGEIQNELRKSVEDSIKSHSITIDNQLMRRFSVVNDSKFKSLTSDIQAIQIFYNEVFADDKKFVNKLSDNNLPVPMNPLVWEAKDDIYHMQNFKRDGI